jgi:hypothetical protein
MVEPMLFYTALPILLGGHPREAGRTAASLYARHGIRIHWYGRGWHPLLAIYAKRHPVSLDFSEANDGIMTRLLCGFEAEQRHTGGIPCLIPCSDAAADFLARNRSVLEEYFVLLESPKKGEDPLYRLVHSH